MEKVENGIWFPCLNKNTCRFRVFKNKTTDVVNVLQNSQFGFKINLDLVPSSLKRGKKEIIVAYLL